MHYLENWMFEVDFSRSFLKHMLGKDLYISDLEDIGTDFFFLRFLKSKYFEKMKPLLRL